MTDQPVPTEEPSALSNATTEELMRELLLRVKPLKAERERWRSLDKATQSKLITLEDIIDSCEDALGQGSSKLGSSTSGLSEEILHHRRIVGIEVTTLGEAEPSYIAAPEAMGVEDIDPHQSVIG